MRQNVSTPWTGSRQFGQTRQVWPGNGFWKRVQNIRNRLYRTHLSLLPFWRFQLEKDGRRRSGLNVGCDFRRARSWEDLAVTWSKMSWEDAGESMSGILSNTTSEYLSCEQNGHFFNFSLSQAPMVLRSMLVSAPKCWIPPLRRFHLLRYRKINTDFFFITG